jgi:hypothetical protein
MITVPIFLHIFDRRYRSKIGAALHRNEGLYQHILKDPQNPAPIVLNYIRGKLLSFIPLVRTSYNSLYSFLLYPIQYITQGMNNL